MAPVAENMRTLNQLARMTLGQLLGISVILLSLPADFLFGVWVVNKIWHPAVLGGPQMPPHPMSLPVPDWEAAIGFIFWLDAGLIGSYGRQACMVATLMWILLLVFGKGLGTKITSLIFLAPSIYFAFAGRIWL